MTNDSYVYVIFRPCGEPCYVGKGKRDRWKIPPNKRNNIHLLRIYEKYGDLPVVKVREFLSEEDAAETEKAFIKALGRRELGTGPLVNMTEGGEGISGYSHLEITRLHLSATMRGKPKHAEFGAKISLVQRGIAKTPEHCAAIGLASRGRKHTKETKERIRSSLIGRVRVFSEEHCAKIKQAKTGKPWSAKRRAVYEATGR